MEAKVSLIDLFNEHSPQWCCAYISELDAVRVGENSPEDLHGVAWYYHRLAQWSGTMAWIVRSGFSHLVHDVKWNGRCGALHLMSRPGAGNVKAFVLGIHGSHGDLIGDDLLGLGILLSDRDRMGTVAVVGDWNIDQLPIVQADPWRELPDRTSRHVDRRALLSSWRDARRMEVRIPKSYASLFEIPLPEGCYSAPVSLVP